MARRVLEAREAQGLTQAQLAERVPCNAQTVSNWETGRRQPRYADLARLAEVLSRPVSWFLGEAPVDDGWRGVAAQVERMAEELRGVQASLAERAGGGRAAADLLAPVSGRVVGETGQVERGAFGWAKLPAGGLQVLRVETEQFEPLVQRGDLLAIEPAEVAATGGLVLARLASGEECLRWLAADDRGSESPAVLGRVVWLHRGFGPAADLGGEAERRLAELRAAEDEMAALVARVECGEGQWREVSELGERLRAEAERLSAAYGSSAVRPVARALAQSARSFGERGLYAEGYRQAQAAAELYESLERLGPRSDEALLNLHNLSQFAVFLGRLDEAEQLATTVCEAADWTVRWKGMKTLDDLRVNYRAEPCDDGLCADLLHLAGEHLADDAVQANLALSVAYELRGNAAFAAGRLDEARAAAEAQLASARAAGLPYRLATAWLDLGQYASASGDTTTARAALAEVAALAAQMDLGDLDAMRLAHEAATLALEGDLDEARRRLFAAARRAGAVSSPRAWLMAELAGLRLALQAGDEQAQADHAAAAREAAGTLGLAPYRLVIARMLEGREL